VPNFLILWRKYWGYSLFIVILISVKKFFKNLAILFLGILVISLILEVCLRIHNPIAPRIKSGRIVLATKQSYKIKNTSVSGLDPIIKITRNSLGFRGEEKPNDFQDYLSAIVVGDSTSEQYYISDDKTWPYLLEKNLKNYFSKVWINNASLDGHSTFSHQVFLEDYLVKIKTKFILYPVGINEIGRVDFNDFDNKLLQNNYASWKDWLSKKSELINSIFYVIRSYNFWRHGLDNFDFDLSKIDILNISNDVEREELSKQSEFLSGYKMRLQKLVETTRANGIEPILLTQPVLWGGGKDPFTGIDLDQAKVGEGRNGKLYWEILELYNDQTRKVAAENNVFLIDLAHLLPKSSEYFYDGVHYNNSGSAKVADIVSAEFKSYLKQ